MDSVVGLYELPVETHTHRHTPPCFESSRRPTRCVLNRCSVYSILTEPCSFRHAQVTSDPHGAPNSTDNSAVNGAGPAPTDLLIIPNTLLICPISSGSCCCCCFEFYFAGIGCYDLGGGGYLQAASVFFFVRCVVFPSSWLRRQYMGEEESCSRIKSMNGISVFL